MEALAVFLGGGVGSLSRYLLSKYVNGAASTLFPLGTFAVNALGCFAIGFLFTAFEERLAPPELRLLLVTGFLGGFTTFSSFGLETVNLAKGGETFLSLVNVAASVVAGLALVIAGMAVAGLLFKRK